MNKNMIIWFAVSAVLMLALPWLAVTFVKGDAGMAVCFLLFFCGKSNILRHSRDICRKGYAAIMEPSACIGCTVFGRYVDIF